MKSSDINQFAGRDAEVVSLGNLLDGVESPGRASWGDIPKFPGIYVVCLSEWGTLSFTVDTGRARFAIPTDVDTLNQKRECILTAESTDILYIGKAGAKKSTLRKRVRALVRFGVGRARNHGGGEWLWQLEGVYEAQLKMWRCARGEPEKLERDLLDRFRGEHGDFPVANRRE